MKLKHYVKNLFVFILIVMLSSCNKKSENETEPTGPSLALNFQNLAGRWTLDYVPINTSTSEEDLNILSKKGNQTFTPNADFFSDFNSTIKEKRGYSDEEIEVTYQYFYNEKGKIQIKNDTVFFTPDKITVKDIVITSLSAKGITLIGEALKLNGDMQATIAEIKQELIDEWEAHNLKNESPTICKSNFLNKKILILECDKNIYKYLNQQ